MRDNNIPQLGFLPSNQNKPSKIKQIKFDNCNNKNKMISIINEDSDYFQSPLKITNIKKITLDPNYKTETFNSQNISKSKLNIIDTISEKNDMKEIALSKEKKIYLYLKDRGNINNNTPNNIIENSKFILTQKEENIDKIHLGDLKKEKLVNNSIKNNINNNNANNIVVNLISSNIERDLSRNNLGQKLKMNKSVSNIHDNNILKYNLDKTEAMKNIEKEPKIIILRDKKSHSKPKEEHILSKKEKKKLDKLNYYTKIMNSANPFILNRNESPLLKYQQNKIRTKLEKNNNFHNNYNINSKDETIKKKFNHNKQKKFLKDYMLMKKSKQKNKNKEGPKNHNKSFSSKKDHELAKKNNSIYINIISNPLQNQIKEENKFNISFSNNRKDK